MGLGVGCGYIYSLVTEGLESKLMEWAGLSGVEVDFDRKGFIKVSKKDLAKNLRVRSEKV